MKKLFYDSAKFATIRSIYKKVERTDLKNYSPVSVLNCFTKTLEKFLYN